MSIRFTRRHLLKSAVAAPLVVSSRVLGDDGGPGVNDRIRVGVIGVGVRGKYLIGNLPDEAQVVAVCDAYLPRARGALRPTGPFVRVLAKFAEGDAATCEVYQNYRQLICQAQVDAVIIAAPDHQHAPIARLAMEAGLDVYLEKPLTLAIAEGRDLIEAAQRTQRIVQVGSQQRTMQVNRQACEFVRDGGIGAVSVVELPNYPGPMPYYDIGEEPVPDGLDWELMQGPAPRRAHHRNLWVKEEYDVGDLLWRGWDLWRDYSGHLMTNWGAHQVDMVQFALGMDATGPVEIIPETDLIVPGIDEEWSDKTPPIGTVPDAQRDRMRFCPVTMRYANGTELRFRPGVEEAVFHGQLGVLYLSRNRVRTDPPDLLGFEVDDVERARWVGPGHVARPHLANWLHCLQTREPPNAPLEAGHRTATVCHLANIARELGRSLTWDHVAERFVNDDAANSCLRR